MLDFSHYVVSPAIGDFYAVWKGIGWVIVWYFLVHNRTF